MENKPPRSQWLCYLGVSWILDHCHILNFFNSLYVPTPLPGLLQCSLPISGLCDLRVLQFSPFSTTPSSSLTALHFPSSIKGGWGKLVIDFFRPETFLPVYDAVSGFFQSSQPPLPHSARQRPLPLPSTSPSPNPIFFPILSVPPPTSSVFSSSSSFLSLFPLPPQPISLVTYITILNIHFIMFARI